MSANVSGPKPASKRKKLAVFLGAGASRPQGLPLTNDIMPEIIRCLANGNLYDHDDYAEDFERLLRVICPDFDRAGAYLPGITELLSLLDHQIAQQRSLWSELNLAQLVRLRRLLVIAVCEVLYEPDPVPLATKRKMNAWRSWIASLLSSPAAPYDVAFITTNYDRIIDEILWEKLGYNRIHEADFGLEWHFADHDCPEEEVPVPAQPLIRSYKLHGSLDYLGCRRCQRVYISSHANYYIPLYKRASYTECHCRQHPLDSVLVVPTLAHRSPFPRLNEIWRRAGDFLAEADAWIIAGYSMPPEDLFIKELLLTAYHHHRGKTPPRIDAVQYKPNDSGDLFHHYFGGKATFRSYYGGLQNYVTKRGTVFHDAKALKL